LGRQAIYKITNKYIITSKTNTVKKTQQVNAMVNDLVVLFWYRVAMVSEEVIFELRPFDKRNQSCEDLGGECSKHREQRLYKKRLL